MTSSNSLQTNVMIVKRPVLLDYNGGTLAVSHSHHLLAYSERYGKEMHIINILLNTNPFTNAPNDQGSMIFK